MILGLDISTSITGVTVLDQGNIVCCEAWDFRKYKTFFEKATHARKAMSDLKKRFPAIEKIFIEQSLQAFRPGFSSAKTILTLAKFNGTLSWMIYDLFSLEPEYIGATTARKLCGIKVPRGAKAKEIVLQHLKTTEPVFKIEYTKFNNPKPECYDKADSIIIAKAGHALCQKQKKEKS